MRDSIAAQQRFDFIQRRQAEQDVALADALSKKRAEKERYEAEIARICEQDPSIRELQSQLKAAYLNQQR